MQIADEFDIVTDSTKANRKGSSDMHASLLEQRVTKKNNV
jgi:hypothetical protein